MKSKKFIFLFLGLLLLLTLSGCNDIFKSYSITYYVDGDKVSLEPAYYFPGREVKLPTSEDLPAIPNLEFSGWYDNAEYEGEIITVIAAAEASDKVFYGKYSSTGTVDPDQPGNPDPEQPGNPDPEDPEEPDTPVDPEEPEQPLSSSIKDVYSKTVGDKVTVEGVITGIYGNNFYINDGVKGILVYLGNETKYASTVKLGANVVVEGSVDIYKDIHQIKTITSLKTSNKTYKATSIKLTNVSQDELKKYPNDLVNLEGVSVSDLGTYASGKDYTVKLTLNGVTVDLFMSRHVAESAKTKVLEVLESLADTDTLNISGLHVSKYNSYQLVITDATSLIKVASSTPDTPVDPEEPDTPVDPEEPEQPSSSLIKDAYSKTVGDKVTVEGVITGIYGNNFYINDGVKGILVYLGNETKYASIVKLGANVVVEGSVDIYKDIHQIKTITSLKISNKTYKATSIKLTNVSQDELKKYPNDLVNLEGVSVSDLGTYESGKDYTVKLTLNGVTVDLFMSRHVAESAKTKVLEVLESLADTDTLNISGLHVSKYNSYQLVITDATSLVKVASSTPDTPVDPEQPEEPTPDTPVDPEIDLEEVFNQTSYKYELTYLYGNEYAEEIYRVNNGKYHFYLEGYYEMYYGLLNSLNHVFYDNEGVWEYLTEEDTDYEYVAMGLFYVDLRLVDTTKLIKQNDYYTCASSYLNELGLILTGYEEDFDSIKIYISNGYVNKIELHSSYEYDGSTEECEYEILISNYGKEVVLFPENAIHAGLGGGGEEEPSEPSGTTIDDVYELSAGTTVTVTGAITGIYGNNFFINDGNKGLLVYMGSETSFNDIIELGNVVTVTGEVSIYKEAHQLQNVSSISLENKTIEVEAEVLEDVEQSTLETNINDLVSVYNLKVETLSTVNLSKDYSFKCSLDGVEVNVFVSRHNSSTFKDALEGYLENVQVGDIITILNAHVSSYSAFQLVLTDPASIVAAPEVVEAIKITCTPSTLNITSNSSLEDVLNELTLHLVYNNGTKTQLTENDFTVDSANYNGTVGTYEFTFTYNDFQTICTVVVREPGSGSFRVNLDHSPILDVKDDMCYDPETNETYGVTQGLPSVGNPKVLVIPVEFNDSPAPSSMVEDLEKAFFGTSEETGWESLKSYYYKSSYGKLTIDGTVLEPFNTGKNVGYYDNLYAQYLEDLDAYYETGIYPDNVEYSIIKSALEYYDDQINYDDYDTDNDGYIDSIYLIYSCSYSYDDDSLWWAYTTQYYTTEYEYYDSVEADFYCFMSYEFLFDDFYGNDVTYNTETIIHETGHLLGLDDYYDYEEGNGPDGGIGGGDMMDYNVGDHNAYSKMMLGWISPIVMTDTDTITLSSFGSSGDAIFIFKDYNGSFFSEYYVIDFYTPDGLNEAQKGNSGLFDAAGIRIYHVDATLNAKEDCYSIYELTKFNNTDTAHKLISLVEADERGDILNNNPSSASDLFKAGKTYSGSKWYSGESTGFIITVDSMSATQATITITLN